MTIEQIRELLLAQRGRIFSVAFRRRRDKWIGGELVARAGDIRVMCCRLHVKKGVRGVQPDRPQTDRLCDCITVYEMAGRNSGFKRIPLDQVVSVNGQAVEIGEEAIA